VRPQRPKSGFTFAELLVLVAAGGVLTTLLMPTLSETRTKLHQQACVANIKQWGMAFYLYSQDNNGWIYYDTGGRGWNDSVGNVYLRYLGGGDPVTTIRIMRQCPARRGIIPDSALSYTMPIGMYKKGFAYAPANVAGSPFFRDSNTPYLPSLRWVPKSSQYLLLIESKGNSITCGNTTLHDAVTLLHAGAPGDPLPAIEWHVGSINCLFGDYHVESLSLSNIDLMDGNCSAGNPHFMLN